MTDTTNPLTLALEKIELLTRTVADLLSVADIDVEDVYEDAQTGGVLRQYDRYRLRLARMLVERLLFEPAVVLDWDTSEGHGMAPHADRATPQSLREMAEGRIDLMVERLAAERGIDATEAPRG